MAAAITLTDLVRAPLDAIHRAIDDKSDEQRAKLGRYFHVHTKNSEHNQLTFAPKHARFYMDNKWGEVDEIEAPTYLFENITSLVAQDVVVDFGINIDGFRKTSNGSIITNASVSDSATGAALQVPRGRMNFNIRFKNVQPLGLQKIQEIQLRTFSEHYQYTIDNRDEKTSEDIKTKIEYEVRQDKFEKSLQRLYAGFVPEKLSEILEEASTMKPLDAAKHIVYVNQQVNNLVNRTSALRLKSDDTEDMDHVWYLCMYTDKIPATTASYDACIDAKFVFYYVAPA